MSSINTKLSKAYGIRDLGLFGAEIIRDGKQVFKSTAKATKFENWQEALNYARANLGISHRDANPVLIYVTDRWGNKVRVNQNALNDPDRLSIPVYNKNGVKITDQKTYNPALHLSSAKIHKANIVGTREYEEDQKALEELNERWAKKDQPQEPLKVPGEGAPQYTFYAGKDVQLSLF